NEQGGDDKTDEAAPVEVHAGEGQPARCKCSTQPQQAIGDGPQGEDGEDARGEEALIQCAHDRLVGTEAYKEGANDGADYADGTHGKRIEHQAVDDRLAAEVDGRQHHGGDHSDGVGLKQVGRHAGTVADVVSDIVSNGGGIARIILRNAGLHLAHEIPADVG